MTVFPCWDGADPTGTITGSSNNDTIELKTHYNISPSEDFLTFDPWQLQVSSIQAIQFGTGTRTISRYC